jgi:hypothetical protein
MRFPVQLTPRARDMLRRAVVEARKVGATDFIGVEHIALAMLRDGDSVPTQVIDRLGYAEAILSELEAVLRSDDYLGG